MPQKTVRLSVHIDQVNKNIVNILSYKGDVYREAKLDEWERFYNYHRPHCAYNGMTHYEALREMLNSTNWMCRE